MPEKKPKMLWFRFARFCCRHFCRLFFKFDVTGKENIPRDGAFIVISNHQSFLDPLFCGVEIKRLMFFMARDTLFKGFFGKILTSVNSIPVRRGEADLTAIKTIIQKLRDGYGVCLFPEATRSEDGKISAFKPGFGLLCRRGNAAIVPAMIDGAFECWPRHKKLFTIGSRITVRYGKPLTAEQLKNMSDKDLADNLTNILRKMQNNCRLELKKEPYTY